MPDCALQEGDRLCRARALLQKVTKTGPGDKRPTQSARSMEAVRETRSPNPVTSASPLSTSLGVSLDRFQMKTATLRHWSTPAVIGAGLFVAVSGVMMFFGIHQPVERAHEWIGLAFAAAIALHLLTHWRGFKGYFKQPLALGIVGALALTTGYLLLPGQGASGAHGIKALVHRVEAAPLSQVATLFERTPDQIVGAVQAAGFEVQGPEQSVAAIAAANGIEPKAVMRLLLN